MLYICSLLMFCVILPLTRTLPAECKMTIHLKPPRYPDFGRLLLAYMFEACPFLVPLHPLRLEGQTDKDYYLALGYRYEGEEVGLLVTKFTSFHFPRSRNRTST